MGYKITVDTTKCVGDGECVDVCPVEVYELRDGKAVPVNMLAGIVLALTGGGALRIPRFPYILSQAIIGCLIARAASPDLLPALGRNWPLFIGVTLATLAVSTLLGLGLHRLRVLPATTGIWGVSPGGAMAMVVLADAYGDDPRIVAFMQYLRMVCVAGTAALVAHAWVSVAADTAATDWFPPLHPATFGPTVGLTILGLLAGRVSAVPSGAMLAPMVAGAVFRLSGLGEIDLPPCEEGRLLTLQAHGPKAEGIVRHLRRIWPVE